MQRSGLIAAALATVLLVGCAENGDKQNLGTILGGVGGALIGSAFGNGTGRVVGVAAGALVGAVVGSEVGKSLDRADRQYAAETSRQALETAPSGHASAWRNPDNGHSGTITPERSFTAGNGQQCREFQQTVTIDNKTESAFGTACRQPDGSWKIQG